MTSPSDVPSKPPASNSLTRTAAVPGGGFISRDERTRGGERHGPALTETLVWARELGEQQTDCRYERSFPGTLAKPGHDAFIRHGCETPAAPRKEVDLRQAA